MYLDDQLLSEAVLQYGIDLCTWMTSFSLKLFYSIDLPTWMTSFSLKLFYSMVLTYVPG